MNVEIYEKGKRASQQGWERAWGKIILNDFFYAYIMIRVTNIGNIIKWGFPAIKNITLYDNDPMFNRETGELIKTYDYGSDLIRKQVNGEFVVENGAFVAIRRDTGERVSKEELEKRLCQGWVEGFYNYNFVTKEERTEVKGKLKETIKYCLDILKRKYFNENN